MAKQALWRGTVVVVDVRRRSRVVVVVVTFGTRRRHPTVVGTSRLGRDPPHAAAISDRARPMHRYTPGVVHVLFCCSPLKA